MSKSSKTIPRKTTKPKAGKLKDGGQNEGTDLLNYQINNPSLQNSNLIKVEVFINNDIFVALIDTGSSISLINKSIVDKLGLETQKCPNPFSVSQLNGNTTLISDSTILSFHTREKIGKTFYTHRVFIIDRMTPEILLGLDFCKRNIAYIMFTDEKEVNLVSKTNETQILEVNPKEYIQIIASDPRVAQTPDSRFWTLISLMASIPEHQVNNKRLKIKYGGEYHNVEEIKEENEDFNFDQIIGTKDVYERTQLLKLFKKYQHLFAMKMNQLSLAKGVEHKIVLTTDKPFKRAPYRVSYKERSIIQEQINEMLASGVIRPSHSCYSSPIVLVKKKDNTMRFCIDFRELNSITVKDSFPIPVIADLLNNLQGARYISTLDMFSGYFQIKIAEEDKHKTAFVSTAGLHEFNRLAFGLCNAPATYQRMINTVFNDYLYSSMMAYLDDVIIFSQTFADHLRDLENAFKKLEEYNLRMKPSKCSFVASEVNFLGFIINETGISADPKKVSAVKNFPKPRTQRDVRAFLGLSGYYRALIKNYGHVARPLTNLLKKEMKANIEWTSEHESSFQELKNLLINAPILGHFIPGGQMILYTDSSNYAMGWILCQIQDGKERVLEYGSKVLSPTQMKYCTSDKEMLAVVTAVCKLRHFLSMEKFIIRVDHHALCYLTRIKDPSGRLMRYALRLQEFDYKIEYKSGKSHTHADSLSRYPDKINITDFKDDPEEIPVFLLSVLKNIEGVSSCTQDCILGYKVDPYYHPIENCTIAEIPEMNMTWKETVYMAEVPQCPQLYIEKEIQEVEKEYCNNLALDQFDMRKAQLADTWCLKIIKSLENNNPKALKRFVLKDGVLYKKTFDDYGQPKELLCLPRELRQHVLKEIHSGLIGGGHGGFFKTIAKLKDRFFYPHRDKSVRKFILSCSCCQFRKTDPNSKKGLLMPIRIGKPFDLVGIDLIGPLPKSGKEGYRYIIVACDYATRFTITKALVEATTVEIIDFIVHDIVCKYGAPRRLLTDNATTFTSHSMQSVLDYFNTEHSFTAPYRPQVNGLVERTNRTLLDSISLYCSANQTNWSKVLPFIEFCHNSAKSKSLKFSPFFALFGHEPTLFIDVNLKINIESDAQHVPEYLSDARHLISENLRDAQYRQKEKYDEKHKDIHFKEGELVAIYKKRRRKGINEKMQLKWEGPYQVIKAYQKPKDYYLLQDTNDADNREQIHISKLKKWYQRQDEDFDPMENFETDPKRKSRSQKRKLTDTNGEGVQMDPAGSAPDNSEVRTPQQIEGLADIPSTQESAPADAVNDRLGIVTKSAVTTEGISGSQILEEREKEANEASSSQN